MRALIEALEGGRIPAAWAPLETTTEEEATFLSPLDPVSARGRAKPLFGFDYVWEVYKPVEKRTFGYYTMPILWGDRLVGRFDPKLDRSTGTLVINGLWLEDVRSRATRPSARRSRGGWPGSCGSSAPGGSMRGRLAARAPAPADGIARCGLGVE